VGHRTREEVCQDMEEKGREMETGREMGNADVNGRKRR
jgi:hypothetical protein